MIYHVEFLYSGLCNMEISIRVEKSLVISNVINGNPEFALVKNMSVLSASLCCFECPPLSAAGWNDRYFAHEVQVPDPAQANVFVDAEKRVDYTPRYYVNFNNSKYVPLKYDLTDIIKHHCRVCIERGYLGRSF